MWDWIVKGFGLAKDVYSAKQSADIQKAQLTALQQQEAAARAAASAAGGANNVQAQQMADALAAQARAAYGSLTQVAQRSPSAAPSTGGTPLDTMLPFIVLGVAALGVFAVFKR